MKSIHPFEGYAYPAMSSKIMSTCHRYIHPTHPYAPHSESQEHYCSLALRNGRLDVACISSDMAGTDSRNFHSLLYPCVAFHGGAFDKRHTQQQEV